MKKRQPKGWGATLSLLFMATLLAVTVGASITGAVEEEEIIYVSEGTSLTVYEQTGSIRTYTFPVFDLITSGGDFLTGASGQPNKELYTVTSDGTYVWIHCYYNRSVSLDLLPGTGVRVEGEISTLPYGELLPYAVANNIVAVRLDGVPDFPNGLWASFVVDYTLGIGGIAESRLNALGDPLIREPEGGHFTILGNLHSEIVFGFTPFIEATVTIVPGSDYITAYIELPPSHEVGDIDFATVMISEAGDTEVNILPESWSLEIGDYDNDEIPDMKVMFDRAELEDLLLPGGSTLTITGRLYGGVSIRGKGVVNIEEN